MSKARIIEILEEMSGDWELGVRTPFSHHPQEPLASYLRTNHPEYDCFDCSLQTFLKQWSNIDVITKEIIYPHCNHDRGIKHFNAAMEKLKSEKISISPPI